LVTAITTSVIAALLIAAVLAALKSRWLYVIVPKLYLNTPLSDGQIVSLTLVNAGLVSEEDVAVTFRAPCKFELIATSKSTLQVSGKTISLPKLSRGESVSVLLLFEGKAFAQEDIDSVESKATKGKIVESKDKVIPLWHHLVVWPLLLLAFGVPFLFGTFVGSETGVSGLAYLDSKLEVFGASKQLAGFKNHVTERYSDGLLKNAVRDKRLTIEVPEIVRRGDILTVRVKITNNTGQVLSVDASIEGTAGGRGPLDFYDSRVEKFAMAPTESRALTLKVFQPEAASVQLVQGTYRFSAPSGEDLAAAQVISFQ
jgi:hypothetical protein